MAIQFRRYSGPDDYGRIDRFLIVHYQPENCDGNWLEPAWEYMHSHPNLDRAALDRIGIWEADGQIAAVAHYEGRLGEAFFQFHPQYRDLRSEMLDYAEASLAGRSPEGRAYLCVFVGEDDRPFRDLVQARGYARDPQEDRPVACLAIPDPFPPIAVPAGFRLQSLADDCDWTKVHRLLWRGFDHPGEPPAEDLAERKAMQDTPHFRHDLKIVAVAPDGDFASFCGMWYEPANRYAYVEPVATDPDCRRMGLGRAAVLAGVRRCAALGATVAYVGSDLPFYLSLGFRVIYSAECWVKRRT